MSVGELTMFGKAYDTVGSTNKNLVLLTRGDLKIRWGNKFIDLIKNGKINVNVDILKQVDSKDSISKDGIYLINEDKQEVWVSIGGTLVNLIGEIGTTYVSFMDKQEVTVDLKLMALTNTGFYYNTLAEANEAKIPKGLVYILEDNKLYYVVDGTLNLYKDDFTIPNPLLIGNVTIDGNNGRIYGSSNIFLGLGNNNYISFNDKNISIDKSIVISEDIISHDYVLDATGFAIYYNGDTNKSCAEFDNIKIRGLLEYDDIIDITYKLLKVLVDKGQLIVGKKYRITDFQNEWELTEIYHRHDNADQVFFNYWPITLTAISAKTFKLLGYFCNREDWIIEYDINFNYFSHTVTYDDGTKEDLYTKGRITKLTDSFGNTGNFDFKHHLFKYTSDSDDPNQWFYTFNIVNEEYHLSETNLNPDDYKNTHINADASELGKVVNNTIYIREPSHESGVDSTGLTCEKLILYNDYIIFPDCSTIYPYNNKILDSIGQYVITGNFYNNIFKGLYSDTTILFTLDFHDNTFEKVLNCILNAPMLFNIFDKDLVNVEFECTTMSNNHFTGIIYTNDLRSTYPIKATNFNNNIINDINISAINCIDITDNNIHNIKNCNIENSTITNTTFKRNIEQLTILNAIIDRCEFNDLINNVIISGNLSKCQFEGLSEGIQINGPLNNMIILESITPSSAQWVQESNPSLLRAIETLTISSTVIPRLSETSHKDCFIKNITTDDGDKVVFWVQLITDDNTPSGVILMWSGDINEVPKGYGICDGRIINGKTMPDLSGRFIRMIDSGESTGPKNNSELSTNGENTRLTYIQILNLNLPIHTHDFTITASIDTSGLSISSILNETRSGAYNYLYSCDGGSIPLGTGDSVEVPKVCSGNVYISIDHSHNINWDNPSISNVQITLNDNYTTYPNNKINIEPNAYALIFIMKL